MAKNNAIFHYWMYIKIKVTPGAKKEKIEKKTDTHYLISVKEPALRNLANNRVCEIMALTLDVSKGKIRIISGHRSQNKIISVNI